MALRTGAITLPILVSAPKIACAQTADWTGNGGSDDWSTPANWSTSSVPSSGTVTINSDVPGSETIGVTAANAEFSGSTLNVGAPSGNNATLALIQGSEFTLGTVSVGTAAGSKGMLHIHGSTLTATNSFQVGSSGHGEFVISGEGARLAITDANRHLNVGNSSGGYGRMEIRDGARVDAWNVSVGNTRGAGELIVDGPGSVLAINGRDLSAAGQTGGVYIAVLDGGAITIEGDGGAPGARGMLQLGNNEQTTTLLLDGAGSRITTTGNALIGEFGIVNAQVEKAALLEVGHDLIVGAYQDLSGPPATLAITGQDSAVLVAGDGRGDRNRYGLGAVTLSEGGLLRSAGDVYIVRDVIDDSHARGALNFGAAAGEAPARAGMLEAAAIRFGSSQGRLVFNHDADATTGPYLFTQDLVGAGTIEHHAGLTRVTSENNGSFTGTTMLRGGTMWIDGTLGGAMDVRHDGNLHGSGTVGPTVNAGTIAPGGDRLGRLTHQFETLTIHGDYRGENGALLIHADLGGDGSPADRLVVKGGTSGDTTVSVVNLGGEGAPTT
ncbi:MAG: autotransporter outer membrane beta-barrel domain-containing protein, partial [Candidimonas sp.]